MTDKERIAQLERALAYAIDEADGWHDDCCGGKINTPEMDAARKLLPSTKNTRLTRKPRARGFHAPSMA